MQIDADVRSVGDLEPEPLTPVALPPSVEMASLAEPVGTFRIGEPDARRRCRNEDRPGRFEKNGTNE
jgi:hypothetical protein